MDSQQNSEPKQTRPYSYISIRGDQYHGAVQPIAQVHQLLKTRCELRDNGDRTYSNAPGFPWLCLALLNCDPMGNYPAGLPQDGPTINLLEFIYVDDGYIEQTQFCIDLACDIAAALGWETEASNSGGYG
jgi:hypothetical protein